MSDIDSFVSTTESSVRLAKALSQLLGWGYFFCWSASFYPQPVLNFQRKSVIGMGIDFPTLNVFGFLCYTTSTAALLFSSLIRSQYAARHPVSLEPTVQVNDLAFGIHAVILTALTYSQFWPKLWGFEVSTSHRIARPIAGLFWGSLLALLMVVLLVMVRGGGGDHDLSDWAWIDVIYTLGYIKVLVTFVKYIPQIILNFHNKSTHGWSIGQILFDLSGGILSLSQLILDASLQNDWSGILGNPTKLGLAVVSMSFDLIFITQHYLLYRDSRGPSSDKFTIEPDHSQQPLLGGRLPANAMGRSTSGTRGTF